MSLWRWGPGSGVCRRVKRALPGWWCSCRVTPPRLLSGGKAGSPGTLSWWRLHSVSVEHSLNPDSPAGQMFCHMLHKWWLSGLRKSTYSSHPYKVRLRLFLDEKSLTNCGTLRGAPICSDLPHFGPNSLMSAAQRHIATRRITALAYEAP